MKKLLALILCLALVLLACASCGEKEPVFTKMEFELHNKDSVRISDNEEEFYEYFDEYMEYEYPNGILIYLADGVKPEDIDLTSLNYNYRVNQDGKIKIMLNKELINKDSIIDLTKDERITKIYFDCQDYIVVPA